MRFCIAFFILLFANDAVDVGRALFLCLWKIIDLLERLKPAEPKPDGAEVTP